MEGADRDSSSGSLPFILEGVTFMVFPNQLRSEHVSLVFPGVVSGGVPLPFDKVLEISPFPKVTVVDDGLDLILLFSINDVWGGTWEIIPILTSFLKRGQEPGMKDVMDGPGRR